ncbi:MAG TPA: nucleotidyltransferase domain-containing protein, partial [Gammaproteobacteria bacterium]|nr:nucleotidyltransferase domain-containing protein [Gammaproteobacteria bacterium]
ADKVRLKVYMYALRPLLAAKWVIRYGSLPAMQFSELVEAFLPSGPIRSIVDELVQIKAGAGEKDKIERIPDLDHYIDTGLKEVENALPKADSALSRDACNAAFRHFLTLVWANG